jgi:alpha-glucosidase (family GH31 glycosyl hydrolase)
VKPGQRRRGVRLPRGPSGWTDFWTGTRYPAGLEIEVDAPLQRVPLLVPDGGMIPMTDTLDFSRLHDEPSRQLRVFPPLRAAEGAFTLYEDDGLGLGYRRGEFAKIAFELVSTARSITLTARRTGDYALPYACVGVVLPRTERRRLTLHGEGVRLIQAAN